jgi:hypothetical protein
MTLGVAALTTIALNVVAGDALLSPRAAGNQAKHISGVSADANLVSVDHYTVTVAPRAADNAISKVAGTTTGTVATCSEMAGTPKAIAECASHPGAPMSCCNIASAK